MYFLNCSSGWSICWFNNAFILLSLSKNNGKQWLQVHWFYLGFFVLWIWEYRVLVLVIVPDLWLFIVSDVLLVESLISTKKRYLICNSRFNSISKEFFFAATAGLILWIGCVFFQYYQFLHHPPLKNDSIGKENNQI